MRRLLAALLALTLGSAAHSQNMMMSGVGWGRPDSGIRTPVISGGSNNGNLTNAAIAYLPFQSGWNSVYAATVGPVQQIMPIGGYVKNMSVTLISPITNTAGMAWDIALNDTGTTTNLHCTIPANQQSCQYLGAYFFNSGAALAWQFTPSNAPTPTQTPPPGVAVSAVFAASSAIPNQGYILMSSVASIAAGTTVYLGPGGQVTANATEINVSGIIPVGGTIKTLYAQANNNVTGGTYTITVEKNGNDSGPPALTCTIPGPPNCPDTTAAHSFTVNAGDTVSCKVVSTTVATARFISCALGWLPSTVGQVPLFINAIGGRPAFNTTSWLGVAGYGAVQTTETFPRQQSPFLISPHTITLSNMWAAQPTALTGSARTVTLRSNLASSPITCPIPTSGGLTIGGTTFPACNDVFTTTGHQLVINAASNQPMLDYQISDTATAGTEAWWKASISAVYQ